MMAIFENGDLKIQNGNIDLNNDSKIKFNLLFSNKNQEASLDYKKKELIKFRTNFENKDFKNEVIKNMWELIDEFNISQKIVADLFYGVESDIREEFKIKNEKELFI